MGDSSPPPAPAPVIIQPPPTQSQNAQDSAEGSAKAFQYILDQGLLPKYAQQMTDIQAQQAPQLSQLNLDQQKIYGPQLTALALANLKAADPTGFAIRENLGNTVQNNLALNGGLSPEELRLAQNDIRAAQVSKGTGYGLSDSIDEARFLGGQRYNRAQQSQANAASFLAGTPPQASFASLNQAGRTAPVGTQDTSGAASALFPSTNALIGNQAQNYGIYAGFNSGLNNLNANNYQFRTQNTTNPFLTGLGTLGGLGSNVVGGMAAGGMFL